MILGETATNECMDHDMGITIKKERLKIELFYVFEYSTALL